MKLYPRLKCGETLIDEKTELGSSVFGGWGYLITLLFTNL